MFDSTHLEPVFSVKKKNSTGLTIDVGGYVLVKKVNHPHKNARGYVRLHRLVMEVVLGRFLESHEHVHHIDGNKRNNDPENLEIMTNEHHRRLHNAQDRGFSYDVDVEKIKDLYMKGYSSREVADVLKIGKSTVGKYIKNLGLSRPQMTKRNEFGQFEKGDKNNG
jgi:hypothetical protein